MFQNEEEIEKRKMEKQEMEKEFEEDRQKSWKDADLKQKVITKYNQMIDDLRSGRVDPNTYRDKEVFHLTMEEFVDLPKESEAFQVLWSKKYELQEARKEAEGKKAMLDALKRTTSREDIDDINFDEVEKGLSQDKFREYMERTAKNLTNPEKEEPAPEPKPKPEKPEEPEEEGFEEKDYSTERNTEYQL